jgi:hypothetical protein
MAVQSPKEVIKRKEKRDIIIAGETIIDEFFYPITSHKPNQFEYNFGISQYFPSEIYSGGIYFIANFLKKLHKDVYQIKFLAGNEIFISRELLEQYPVGQSKEYGEAGHKNLKIFRGREFLGMHKKDLKHEYYPEEYSFEQPDEKDIDIIIIHDIGKNFRENTKISQQLKKYPENIYSNVILQIHPPYLISKEKNKDYKEFLAEAKNKLLIFVNCKDLRLIGANISYRLSWEKTAEELIFQIFNNKDLVELRQCSCLIVRIGLEGVLVIKNPLDPYENLNAKLYFNPVSYEDNFYELEGNVQGISIAFLSGFIESYLHNSKIFEKNEDIIIKNSISIAYNMWLWGYGKGVTPVRIPDEIKNDNKFLKLQSVNIQHSDLLPDSNWTILSKNRKGNSIGKLAYSIVENGIDHIDDPENNFPILQIGKLITIDRSEIECYHSIKNIMKEYIESENIKTPISIAVFGPPGSGKSFGIKEIVNNFQNQNIKFLTFNLSQFTEVKQLTSAFHKIRDYSLIGRLPVVFFDEFDSNFNDIELGWIKHFLAPMQDGVFFDGENFHPIGRCIFVFAGGISHNYKSFCGKCIKLEEGKEDILSSKDPKIRDFISRLRGFINIIGCNPREDSADDGFYKIRRALLLRSVLMDKVPQIVDAKKVSIDKNVLRAFIKVKKYKHGVRSIHAIIEMSNLRNKKSFDASALPVFNQLNLHVDAEDFNNYILRRIHFQESVEKMVDHMLHNHGIKMEEFNANQSIIRELILEIPKCFDKFHYGFIRDKDVKLYEQETPPIEKIIDYYKPVLKEKGIEEKYSEIFSKIVVELLTIANFKVYQN